jgi:serine/threonine protein phosphatase PrpC
LTDQDAVTLLKDESDAQLMAEKLVKRSILKGSTDNVTVIVIVLN